MLLVCVIGKANVSRTTFDQGLKFQTGTNNDSWVDRYTAGVVVHACVVTSPCQLVWIQPETRGGWWGGAGGGGKGDTDRGRGGDHVGGWGRGEGKWWCNRLRRRWRGSGGIGPHTKAGVEAKKVAVAEVKEKIWERERELRSHQGQRTACQTKCQALGFPPKIQCICQTV